MSAPDDSRPDTGRRREVLGGAAAAMVMLAVIVIGLFLRGSGDGGAAAAAGTTTPAATSSAAEAPTPAPAPAPQPAAPEQPVPSGDPSQLPPSMAAVAFDQEAVGADGVTARVVSLEAVEGTGEGPGNIAGPALRATVRLVNGTPDPVDLGLVVVNLTHGAEGTPASPVQDDSRVPFGGMLAAGGSAEGVYVFTVPEDVRDHVTLTVGYRADSPFLTFSGTAD